MVFELLNIFYLTAVAIAQPVTVQVKPPIHLPEVLGQTVKVEAKRPWLASDSDCAYSGQAVPYERTWELVTPAKSYGEPDTRLPPDPGKIAGYVILFNVKTCEGKPDQVVSYAAEKGPRRNFLFGNIEIVDTTKLPPEAIPPWFGQALQTVGAAGIPGYAHMAPKPAAPAVTPPAPEATPAAPPAQPTE